MFGISPENLVEAPNTKISSKTVYHVWNWTIVLDTIFHIVLVAYYPSFFIFGSGYEFVVVPIGTLLSVTYLIAFFKLDDGDWDTYVVYGNAAFLVVSLLGVIYDVAMRIFNPDSFCVESDPNTTCERVWDQLLLAWLSYFGFLFVWIWVIKRSAIYVTQKQIADEFTKI